MVNWESQSKTPPRVRKTDTFIVFLLIHIILCHVSKNLLLRCLFYVTMNIYFCVLCQHCTWRSSRLCLYLLNIYQFTSHFHMHIQRHIHTSTHVQSTHKRNNDSRAQGPGWEGRKKDFVRDLTHTHTHAHKKLKKIDGKNRFHESKRKDSNI